MSGDLQHLIAVTLYMLCFEIISTNSRTSTLWKLNSDQTKIVEANPFHQVVSYPGGSSTGAQFVTEDDPVFNIITSTVHMGQSWVKERVEYYCTNCHTLKNSKSEKFSQSNNSEAAINTQLDEILDCGKPVNFTYYDNLVGVLNRHKHPHVPEPQAASFFIKKAKDKNAIQDLDMKALELKLKRARRERPRSVQILNQIGNFYRITGDTGKSIECFRRALSVSPHNADVLLNLARVLFTLQYLDDAIYLTRRSLEVQAPDKGAWQQYFTLGEILKAYGHYQEATMHLKHTLELKPGYEPAQIALKEMESMPAASIHVYTLVIIICLVLGVLLVILSSVEAPPEIEPLPTSNDVKPQRHFNKAMAMRSLRGFGMVQKHSRSKKIVA